MSNIKQKGNQILLLNFKQKLCYLLKQASAKKF